MLKTGSTADICSFLWIVSHSPRIAYKEDQTMQMKSPSHKLPLWCEYEWTGVNRDAWDCLPARSVQHNSCCTGFQSIRGTQSSACWGCNGLTKAPCFTGEKTLLHSINQYPLLHSTKVSPFSHPARCLRLEGIVVNADLWLAHDILMQRRNVEMSECVWREVEHLWSLNVLGSDVSMSRCAACTPMVICVANCAAVVSYETLVRFSSRGVWILFHVDAGSAPHRRYCCWGMWSPPALHSYLSAASLQRSTGLTCDTVPSAQTVNTLVIAGHGRQEGSLFNLILCESRCLLMYFPRFKQTYSILTSSTWLAHWKVLFPVDGSVQPW